MTLLAQLAYTYLWSEEKTENENLQMVSGWNGCWVSYQTLPEVSASGTAGSR